VPVKIILHVINLMAEKQCTRNVRNCNDTYAVRLIASMFDVDFVPRQCHGMKSGVLAVPRQRKIPGAATAGNILEVPYFFNLSLNAKVKELLKSLYVQR